jgi:hypothetical protein
VAKIIFWRANSRHAKVHISVLVPPLSSSEDRVTVAEVLQVVKSTADGSGENPEN